MMEIAYQPYFDPNYESLIERIHPPRVCIDNESHQDCTLVKVDSANKHGILLEMVQILTDLDLVISKSYISSDGGWFMDVFHLTDQLGNKLVDESLILYIEQALCASRRENLSRESIIKRDQFKSHHLSTNHTGLEITGTDRPGLLSEISAALAELNCHIASAAVWTHNGRTACVIYVEDAAKLGVPIPDPDRIACIKEQLENVVEAHHSRGESRSVRLTSPAPGQMHTERRLHQLMFDDKDYEQSGCQCKDLSGYQECPVPHVSIEGWKEKGYSVVNIKCRDRPKLLFDTVCALTDMEYVVAHAAVSSEDNMAIQEFFIRRKGGRILDEESEKHKLAQCLIAAIERRVSHGLRLDVRTQNKRGLLSDVTRAIRECGLSITRTEIRTRGERAIGSFYVTDAAGQEVDPRAVDMIKKEVGESALTINRSAGWITPQLSSASIISRSGSNSSIDDHKPRMSLGGLLWSKLEQLSSNFSPIKL